MRDTKSLLLVLLSAGLVGTWAYHLYDKATHPQEDIKSEVVDATLAQSYQDSIKKIYNDSLAAISAQRAGMVNSDSLQFKLDEKLQEIEKLKKEIAAILGNSSATREDLVVARHKRDELQVLVDELNDHNRSIADEKAQLASSLQQLSQEVEGLQKNVAQLTSDNEKLTEKVNLASIFVASDLKLEAVDVKSGNESETSKAKNTDKLVASFAVQNNVADMQNAETVIVMLQPDGQVLRSNVWDSGSFDTRSNGKKNYTRRIKFDYAKGESKKLLFTLDVQDCQKGNYLFQVWHNGVMIGQSAKQLL